MKKLLLIGPEECFSAFQAVEEDLRMSYEVFSIKLKFGVSLEKQLLKFSPSDFSVLIFCDDRFSNLVRKSMVLSIKEKGYTAISYQSPLAQIGKNVVIAENAIVMSEAVLEDGVQIGAYTLISKGCCIAQNARIGEATTLNAYCRIGREVIIGHQVILGMNVMINDGAVIGSDCEISTPGSYEGTIESKTYLHPKLGGTAKIYSFDS